MNSTSSTKPWQFYMTASFLAAAAAVWLSPPATPVAMLLISLAIGAAGACATALHALLTSISGQRELEAGISESQRAALEREKLFVLRSIKDLQFDMAMGKMSAADAAPMEARLRERAAALTLELDSREGLRARVEADVAQRQARHQSPELRGGVCQSCGTANDADAKFCKSCGGRL